jgi:hypothetical protein
VDDLQDAAQGEFKGSNLLDEFVELGAGAGCRRSNPIDGAVVGKIKDGSAPIGLSVFFLDVQ